MNDEEYSVDLNEKFYQDYVEDCVGGEQDE
jgi:hypothetical protein